MNCDGVRGLLSAYVDGELSAGELLRVEQHLRRCHCCADDVDSLRQTIALVASLDEVEVPASFHTQLHERLAALGPPVVGARRTKAPVAPQRMIPKWVKPAAAAAAVLAIGLTSLQQVKDAGGLGTLVQVQFPSDLMPKQGELAGNKTPGTGSNGPSTDTHGKNPTNSTDPGKDPKPTGGTDANVGQQPTTPTGSNVQEGSSGVVVAHTGAPNGQNDTKPLTSYLVTLNATASTSARQSLMGIGSAQQMHDGSIRITVPAVEREKTLTAIRAVAGLTVTGEQTDTRDYGAEVARAREALEHWKTAVITRQRQVDNMAPSDDRQAAQVSLDEARQQVEYVEASIRHLESEAGKAIFEIRLQAAAQ